MRRDFQPRKRMILGTLGILIVADLALIGYSWRAAQSNTSPKQLLEAANLTHKLLKADVERARKIQKDIPAAQQDCDRFEKQLPPASAAYSVVVSEIGDLARKSGVRLDTLTYKQKDVPSRPLKEVEITASVNGNYSGVVHFVNNLQRSQGMYILDSLSLVSQSAQAAAGQLRVELHLRTYFRAS